MKSHTPRRKRPRSSFSLSNADLRSRSLEHANFGHLGHGAGHHKSFHGTGHSRTKGHGRKGKSHHKSGELTESEYSGEGKHQRIHAKDVAAPQKLATKGPIDHDEEAGHSEKAAGHHEKVAGHHSAAGDHETAAGLHQGAAHAHEQLAEKAKAEGDHEAAADHHSKASQHHALVGEHLKAASDHVKAASLHGEAASSHSRVHARDIAARDPSFWKDFEGGFVKGFDGVMKGAATVLPAVAAIVKREP